jgi:ubiquinone/menaquinone biosynthesis C-methylase UbiE
MREVRFKRELILLAQIQPGQQVLDLGCGTATLTVMIKQAQHDAQVTGLDADLDALKIGQEKAEKAGVVLKLDHGMSCITLSGCFL